MALLWTLGGNSKTLDCKLCSDSLGTNATCLDDLQAAQPKPKAVGRLRRALRDSKVESNEINFRVKNSWNLTSPWHLWAGNVLRRLSTY